VIVDVHGHLFPRRYVDRLAALGHPAVAGVGRMEATDDDRDVAARLELMDEAGVDLQVVSPSSLVPSFDDVRSAARAARLGNDAYAELAALHLGRLAAFALVPLPHVEAAIAEADRALAISGIVGVAVTTSVAGRSIADAAYEPFLAELGRRSAVLFVHPAGEDAGSRLIAEAGLSWMIGAPIEDTFAAVHLIARGILSRFPGLRVVIPHLGGALPMLLRRLDAQFPRLVPDAPEPPSVAVRRMWFDTVCHGHGPALQAAIESFGADRLLLGTDYPYIRGAALASEVDLVRNSGPDADAILGASAAALLGLDR
jgi:aminocarboxymuconate-semialdehyde decarboxylase